MMDTKQSEREKLLDEKHVEIVPHGARRSKRPSSHRNAFLGFAVLATAVLYFTSGPCRHHPHHGPNDEAAQWQSEGWFPSRSYTLDPTFLTCLTLSNVVQLAAEPSRAGKRATARQLRWWER